MPKLKKEQPAPIKRKTFTDMEMRDLEKILSPYLNDKGYLTLKQEFMFYKDQKLAKVTLRKDQETGELLPGTSVSHFDYQLIEGKVDSYFEMEEKLRQFYYWKNKEAEWITDAVKETLF